MTADLLKTTSQDSTEGYMFPSFEATTGILRKSHVSNPCTVATLIPGVEIHPDATYHQRS